MDDTLARMLILVSVGLAAVLLLRRPLRRLFGAGPAFALWALPWLLAIAPWLPLPYHGGMPILVHRLSVLPDAIPMLVETGALARGTPIDWIAPALVAIWLLGALYAMVRLSRRYARLWRHMQALPTDLSDALRRACPQRSRGRLRMHPLGPAVVWAWRTRVLLPHDFLARFDARTRRLVLRHELAHARRGDAWWTLAAELTHALLWFHPLAWWSRSRFRLDMELACDERVLRASPGQHVDYAHALMASSALRPQAALIAWLSAPQLTARMRMIARSAPGGRRRVAGLTAIAALAAGGLLASATVMGTPRTRTWMPNIVLDATGQPVTIRFLGNDTLRLATTDAAAQRTWGQVLLDVHVDAAGHITHARVDQPATSATAAVQQAVLQALRRSWRFRPRAGRPMAYRVQWTLTAPLDHGLLVGYTIKVLDHGVQARDPTSCTDATPCKQNVTPVMLPLLVPADPRA